MIFGELLLKLAVTIGFVAAIIILNFSLFSVGIKNNHRQITLLALVIGTVNFYFKFVLLAPYFMLVQTFVYIIMLMILRRYPFLYALIVSVTGSLFATLTDVSVSFPALQFGFSTLDLMAKNLYHYILFHSLTAAAMLLIALAVHRFGLRFSFVVRRFMGKCFTMSDMVWAVILITTLTALQITTMNLHKYSLHIILLIMLSLSLIGVLLYAYIQNNKITKYRFGEGAGR